MCRKLTTSSLCRKEEPQRASVHNWPNWWKNHHLLHFWIKTDVYPGGPCSSLAQSHSGMEVEYSHFLVGEFPKEGGLSYSTGLPILELLLLLIMQHSVFVAWVKQCLGHAQDKTFITILGIVFRCPLPLWPRHLLRWDPCIWRDWPQWLPEPTLTMLPVGQLPLENLILNTFLHIHSCMGNSVYTQGLFAWELRLVLRCHFATWDTLGLSLISDLQLSESSE